jgi:methionyl-tRNA formyltransferase
VTLPRSVFLGTPETAVPALRTLTSISEVGLVVTRPDRPRGRSGHPQAPAVKEAALALGLRVAQPGHRAELLDFLTAQAPFDVGVVAAFGMLLPPSALALPRMGMINLHFSLLPRWRGAAPVIAAISAGDQETGVTLMKIDEGLDTGPVIAAAAVVIGDDETGGALASRLAVVGARLLAAHLSEWLGGTIPVVAQDPTRATIAPSLKPKDRLLDLGSSAEEAARRVRALSPNPGAVLNLDGLPHQILAAEPVRIQMEPGEVRLVNAEFLVGLARGGLRLSLIQPPGRRPLEVRSWLRGLRQLPTRAVGEQPLR